MESANSCPLRVLVIEPGGIGVEWFGDLPFGS